MRGVTSAATPTTAAISTMQRTTANFSPLPDKPSIAVLPFQNMSGDAEQEYFVGWHGGGYHHCAVALQIAVRHRTQLKFCL